MEPYSDCICRKAGEEQNIARGGRDAHLTSSHVGRNKHDTLGSEDREREGLQPPTVLPLPPKSIPAGRDTAKSSYTLVATEEHEKEEEQGRRGGSRRCRGGGCAQHRGKEHRGRRWGWALDCPMRVPILSQATMGKVLFFALKQFISIQAPGAFFMATSDFEAFHLTLELAENQDGFPGIFAVERVKTIILSPETWLKD